MRGLSVVAVSMVLAACAPAPQQVKAPPPDPTTERWYAETTAQLAALDVEAERLVQAGQFEAAAAAITKGQPLESRLLAAPRPTLAAMQASSDLDDLYARMLVRDKRYGWARSFYQKNVARWKNWKPQTPETEQRLRAARSGVADCDRRLAE